MTARTALTVKKPAATIMTTATARLLPSALMERIQPLPATGGKKACWVITQTGSATNLILSEERLKSGNTVMGRSPKSKIPHSLEKKRKEESSKLTKAATEIDKGSENHL